MGGSRRCREQDQPSRAETNRPNAPAGFRRWVFPENRDDIITSSTAFRASGGLVRTTALRINVPVPWAVRLAHLLLNPERLFQELGAFWQSGSLYLAASIPTSFLKRGYGWISPPEALAPRKSGGPENTPIPAPAVIKSATAERMAVPARLTSKGPRLTSRTSPGKNALAGWPRYCR